MKKGFWQRNKYFTGTGKLLLVSLFLMASLFILPGKVMADEGWGPGQQDIVVCPLMSSWTFDIQELLLKNQLALYKSIAHG